MLREITSQNLAALGFGALMVVGLLLLVVGAIFLRRDKVTSGPVTNIAGGSVKIDAGPAALILLAGVACVGLGGYLLAQTVDRNSPTVTVAPSSPVSAPATSSSAGPVPVANVTYPRSGTQVSRQHGFIMGGTVANAGRYTLWILDHPPGYYVVDVEATVAGGKWAAADRPLGDSSDTLPYSRQVVAVVASPACADTLNQVGSSSITDHISVIPPGCVQVGQVTVDVSRP